MTFRKVGEGAGNAEEVTAGHHNHRDFDVTIAEASMAAIPAIADLTQPNGLRDRKFLDGGGAMGELFRSFPWQETELGCPENWPQSLRTAVGIMLNSRYPMFVWWGDSLTNLYNDAYRPFLGEKHPLALGQSARNVWAEIWNLIGPRTEAVLTGGTSTFDEALLLIMDRFGYAEETYFTFSYSPIRDDQSRIGGIFCAVTDETQRVIGERRLRLLREVAAACSECNSPEQVCSVAAKCMSLETCDLPFALLYLNSPDGRSTRIVASCGIASNWSGAPATMDLRSASEVWPVREAALACKALVVENLAAPGGPGRGCAIGTHRAIGDRRISGRGA